MMIRLAPGDDLRLRSVIPSNFEGPVKKLAYFGEVRISSISG